MTDKELKISLEYSRIKNLNDLLRTKLSPIKPKDHRKKILTKEDFRNLLIF